MTIETDENALIQINVQNLIRDKKPGLYKLLPGFVIRYLRRLIHEDELNEILRKYHGYKGIDFNNRSLEHLGITISVENKKNIPVSGRYIFVANHPLGGIESLAFMKAIAAIHPKIKFPVNDLLYKLNPYRSIFLPLNKFGGQSKEVIKMHEEAYQSDAQILFYPAGMVSRKIKGEVTDLEWKKTFVSKAVQYDRDIVPVFIRGRNTNFFYRLSNIRKFLGVKVNIEMLFLVDELFKKRNSTISMVVGEVIPNSTFDNSRSYLEWAQWVKNRTYQLQ